MLGPVGATRQVDERTDLPLAATTDADDDRDPYGDVLADSHHKGADMPFINVKIIEGVFTPEQKHEIIRKLTDTMVGIEGENMRSVTSCVLEEVRSGDWGIGGQPMTTEDVLTLARGAAVAV